MKMISSTGSKRARRAGGFTFFEVLVAAVILASGITMIYRAFLVSLDYQRYISCRLYAGNLLEDRMNQAALEFELSGQPPAAGGQESRRVTLNHQDVTFTIVTALARPAQTDEAMQIEMGVFWNQRGKTHRLTRSTVVSVVR